MALSDELEALAKRHGATSYRNRADTQHPAYGFTEDGLNGLIGEVLAKWGTPAPVGAGEVVAWVDERAIGWLKNSRAHSATITTTLGKAKSSERPMPLHGTPQPTQAQAGAVPLTPFIPAQRERLYNNRPENVGKGASLADWHRIVQFIEAAHGIKGGQHGTE